MKRADIAKAAEGLADVLNQIERHEVEATPAHRAYLSGALTALRVVLGEEKPDSLGISL